MPIKTLVFVCPDIKGNVEAYSALDLSRVKVGVAYIDFKHLIS